MDSTHVTVARRTEEGWECVDDFGRRLAVPLDEVDPELRDLRVGQRLALVTESGRRTARLP